MLNIEKLTYSIGQISELTEIAQSTLRYWETVIDGLSPFKTEGGSRRYSKADLETILKIKDLLYNQGYTIKGANLFFKKLKDEKQFSQDNTIQQDVPGFTSNPEKKGQANNNLIFIVSELKRIKNILE